MKLITNPNAFLTRVWIILTDRSGEFYPENYTKVKVIGGITYEVFSRFNEKAKGDVIDKISRLIEKEARAAERFDAGA